MKFNNPTEIRTIALFLILGEVTTLISMVLLLGSNSCFILKTPCFNLLVGFSVLEGIIIFHLGVFFKWLKLVYR
ncbi:MAG: hypothetical protein TRG1_3221 [Flavobacteriaceae bacterium FS1-H7996/R]|nr:MAG: hypothetical protein TRG1_3221 [Flavobacteriaceae bacterium FS1-H7996/R]